MKIPVLPSNPDEGRSLLPRLPMDVILQGAEHGSADSKAFILIGGSNG